MDDYSSTLNLGLMLQFYLMMIGAATVMSALFFSAYRLWDWWLERRQNKWTGRCQNPAGDDRD